MRQKIASLLQTAHRVPQNKNLRVAIATLFLKYVFFSFIHFSLSVLLKSKSRHLVARLMDSILEVPAF